MIKSKVISLGLIFSFTSAFGSMNESVTNIYHPPAVKLESVRYSVVKYPESLFPSVAISKSEVNSNTKESDPLIEFMNKSLEPNKEDKIVNTILNMDSKYKYLNKKFLLQEEFAFAKVSEDETTKLNKIKKMQKLANYISDQYEVPLENAEKIVYSVFVEANKKNLEPILVLSMIGVESTFKQYTKSSAGAVGYMQVMPKVHRVKIGELRKSNTDVWAAKGNIMVGTQILREYIDLAGGNLRKALQMYNGSARDISYKYSKKIMSKMNMFHTVASNQEKIQ